ncbi:uncharacterized protein LOC134202222 [Armigeres subalbatus]|uniref:uncharacterized protein LOC134202222 n=1 Tax=Armigeres subalbatus TaxID=124917 RepID=UPI002ED12CED
MTAPSYQLSKFVGKIIQQSLVSAYNIRDSYSICEFINNITLPESYVLISLDVKALFSSIPKSLVMHNVIMKWNEIRSNTNINVDLFLEIVEYCIDSSYFRYDGQHYHQIFGTAMGNPLSPSIADWVMETLLDTVIEKLNFPLPFVKKYVDDVLTAIPLNQLQHVLETFNSYDIHIQFTYGLEVDNCLPFLDMLLTRHENQKVTTRWYQKPIASVRVNKLSTNIDDNTKHKIIDEQLKLNNYPKSLRNRLQNRMNERNDSSNTGTVDNGDLEYTYRSIAYIPHLSNRVDKEIKRNYKNIRLATYNCRTVGGLFTNVKDPIPEEQQTDVIYSIPCNDCPACYIGMTKNRLKTRISGHRTHYNTLDKLQKNEVNTSDPRIMQLKEKTALLEHSITENHRFNMEKRKY